jgi:hypothetical protein
MSVVRLVRGCVLATAVIVACSPAPYTQTHLPAAHNWALLREHPGVDALFNAFDYGHAVALEVLHARGASSAQELEGSQYQQLTREILVRPPSVPLDGTAIAPTIAKLAPELLLMFEWAHTLHRQIYDVCADRRLPEDRKRAEVDRILRYYASRRDLALSATPKSMEIMDGQPYSNAFRRSHPRFSTLLWSYHWLQIAVYEALLAGSTPASREELVDQVTVRFRQMFAEPSTGAPTVMPMSAAVAPAFVSRYPDAAIVFDNLHALHDVVADILASDAVPRSRKRAELLSAMARFRDDSSYATTQDEWRRMSIEMGVEQMGGVAVRARPE